MKTYQFPFPLGVLLHKEFKDGRLNTTFSCWKDQELASYRRKGLLDQHAHNFLVVFSYTPFCKVMYKHILTDTTYKSTVLFILTLRTEKEGVQEGKKESAVSVCRGASMQHLLQLMFLTLACSFGLKEHFIVQAACKSPQWAEVTYQAPTVQLTVKLQGFLRVSDLSE